MNHYNKVQEFLLYSPSHPTLYYLKQSRGAGHSIELKVLCPSYGVYIYQGKCCLSILGVCAIELV